MTMSTTIQSGNKPKTKQKTQKAGRSTRKWHPRVFTGCLQCRKRHVKCDENPGHCNNCARLGLACDGPKNNDFQIINASTYQPSNPSAPTVSPAARQPKIAHHTSRQMARQTTRPRQHSLSTSSSSANSPMSISSILQSPTDGMTDGSLSSRTGSISDDSYDGRSESTDENDSFSLAIQRFASIGAPSLVLCNDTKYHTHFLKTVSSLLLVFDTPANGNPFRMLPQFARHFGPLSDTMKALAALHMANICQNDQRFEHGKVAMESYGNAVVDLRKSLTTTSKQSKFSVFATSLLLCMFEMMQSRDAGWKIHLHGAQQMFQSIFGAHISDPHAQEDPEDDVVVPAPMRRFLVSLMSYLDMAGACATGEGPLVPGDYWEKWGGGWEYNLGTPSFQSAQTAADRELALVRSSWSRLMFIQADISNFSKSKKAGLDVHTHQMLWEDLSNRLLGWRTNAPKIYDRLAPMDEVPLQLSEEDEILRSAACVEAYHKACLIFLNRVGSGRLTSMLVSSEIDAAVNRVLTLCINFSDGMEQLGILWALFTAGVELVDPDQQLRVRNKLTEMLRFGFKHIEKALEILEHIWFRRRTGAELNADAFERLVTNVLLP